MRFSFPFIFNYMLEKVYPITLPTLKPPNTNATARERSSNGIDLHMVMNLTNQKDWIFFIIGRTNVAFVRITLLAYNLKDQDLELNAKTNLNLTQ